MTEFWFDKEGAPYHIIKDMLEKTITKSDADKNYEDLLLAYRMLKDKWHVAINRANSNEERLKFLHDRTVGTQGSSFEKGFNIGFDYGITEAMEALDVDFINIGQEKVSECYEAYIKSLKESK